MGACYVLDFMYVLLCEWARDHDRMFHAAGQESQSMTDLRNLCGMTLDDEVEEDWDEEPQPTNIFLLRDVINRVNATGGPA